MSYTNLPVTPIVLQRFQNGQLSRQTDQMAQEVPVALVYNGISHVVMMASPQELEAFALGFTLSEGIAQRPEEVYAIEIKAEDQGISIQIELAGARFYALKAQRRQLAGRTGCGLCGTEQLSQVYRSLNPLTMNQAIHVDVLFAAMQQIKALQPLSGTTACAHAAAWLQTDGKISHISEDIGRHVALDKLIGIKAKAGWQQGAALITSRASYEMVQKTVSAGIEILAAIGAPTALAVEMAQSYQLTLLGFCRPDRFNLYTGSERIIGVNSS